MAGKWLSCNTQPPQAPQPPAWPDLSALFWAADAALYSAKHAGGDTVRTAPEPRCEGDR